MSNKNVNTSHKNFTKFQPTKGKKECFSELKAWESMKAHKKSDKGLVCKVVGGTGTTEKSESLTHQTHNVDLWKNVF